MSKTWFSKIYRVILTFTFAILFLTILPIVLTLLSPLYLYRFLIIILCPLFRSDLASPLSTHSTFYSTSHKCDSNTPPWANITLNMKIEGKLNLERMISKLVRVGFGTMEKSEKLMYPEFHQYCVPWNGFLFWKWEEGDEKTKVKNHISAQKIPNEYSASPEDYVVKFSNEFLKTPFKKGQSPWEVIFLEYVPNVPYDKGWYVVLFKFHHSLADGCSIFNVMMNCVDKPVKMTLPKVTKSRWLPRLLNFVVFPFKGAYDFSQVYVEAAGHVSPWYMDQDQMSDSRDFAESKIISIEKLKNTGDSFGVSVSAVVIAALAGGIGRYLKKQGNSPPVEMMCQMPVPIPNHPDGLTNSFSVVSLKLSTGTESIEDRFKSSEKTVLDAKSSLHSTVAFLMGHLFGALPQWILKSMKTKFEPLQLSIFPGPRSLMTFDGHPVLNMSYTICAAEFIPVVITLLSYNSGIQIILNVDSNLFPAKSTMLKDLIADIENEFDLCCRQRSDAVKQV